MKFYQKLARSIYRISKPKDKKDLEYNKKRIIEIVGLISLPENITNAFLDMAGSNSNQLKFVVNSDFNGVELRNKILIKPSLADELSIEVFGKCEGDSKSAIEFFIYTQLLREV